MDTRAGGTFASRDNSGRADSRAADSRSGNRESWTRGTHSPHRRRRCRRSVFPNRSECPPRSVNPHDTPATKLAFALVTFERETVRKYTHARNAPSFERARRSDQRIVQPSSRRLPLTRRSARVSPLPRWRHCPRPPPTSKHADILELFGERWGGRVFFESLSFSLSSFFFYDIFSDAFHDITPFCRYKYENIETINMIKL